MQSLHAFALDFFDRIGYTSPRAFDQSLTYDEAQDALELVPNDLARRALGDGEERVHLLFQFTADELSASNSLFAPQPDPALPETFVFVALDLREGHYSRSDLAALARQVNRPFASPVIALFRHGTTLSLASVARRLNHNDESKHVLQKVSMLKEIGIGDANIHPAHFQILNELQGARTGARNWTEFFARWNAVLDISELNKRFFRELSDWYFNARRHCQFPKPADDPKSDEEHLSTALIRLVTRVMFSYFLKERGLVPAELFDAGRACAMLRQTDADQSTYYRAVLQNLFFATLNTEMGERAWKGASKGGYNPEFLVHNKRRYGDYFHNRDEAAALFGRVPFLNGGLFECLDTSQKQRYDGFSERADNPLSVPNHLFWGPDVKVDLAPEYGSNTPVVRNVRALLPLFAAYKWTVAENTPLEEEVALDPELLGKVFENLLASYNPETKATARKQSGSFYTPREIVDYMVTESLVAYLGAQTEVSVGVLRGLFGGAGADVEGSAGGKVAGSGEVAALAELEGAVTLTPSGLRPSPPSQRGEAALSVCVNCELPSTSADGNAASPLCEGGDGRSPEGVNVSLTETSSLSFANAGVNLSPATTSANATNEITLAQTRSIIAAIERLTLLDPAVGSGAFPMGALQSLVELLRKLDPDNQLWRAQLEASAGALTVGSEGALAQIADVWERDSGDYARKLYLIEHCLFGVDIQPIAIQIAKLRFFIALAIEQKGNDNPADNFGIRPLPNLETKLVAANTLLELESGQLTLTSENVRQLQLAIDRKRSAIFGASVYRTKKTLRDEETALRGQLAAELQEIGMAGGAATRLAQWDPYDQNQSAGFFDPRWMFGLDQGFDIVIGNPPYIHGKSGFFSAADKKYFRAKYETAEYQMDTYILFTERGGQMLKNGGVLTFIIPNTWISNIRLEKIRKFLLTKFEIQRVTNLPGDVFSQAVVDTVVLTARRAKSPADTIETGALLVNEYTPNRKLSRKEILARAGHVLDVNSDEGTSSLMQKMLATSVEVQSIAKINRGVHAYRKDGFGATAFGKGFQTERDYEERSYHADSKLDSTYFREIRGKHIHPYHLDSPERYVSWGDWLAEPRTFQFFEGERIYLRKIVGKTLYAQFVVETNVADQSVYIAKIESSDFNPKFVLGVLNSVITAWYFRNKNNEFDALFPQIKVTEFKKLPIPNATASQQAEIAGLVEAILAARAGDAGADVSALEAEIDARVYALYGLDEAEIALIEAP